MEKLFIKNRNDKNLSVIVDKPASPIGLAFVMHGLGGFKEQLYIEGWAKAYVNNGYTAIRFDTANTIGESEGEYEKATITNYYEDLEDVINWSKAQDFYIEPFCLVGHSLGGICIALYAENYPEEVKALAPISTVVSGKLSFESYDEEVLKKWEETGWTERVSKSRPGVVKKLPWSHMQNRLKYDLLDKVQNLTVPVLMMVGSVDDLTKPEHQQILFESLPGKKELHIIDGSPYTFREDKHIQETCGLMNAWIAQLEN